MGLGKLLKLVDWTGRAGSGRWSASGPASLCLSGGLPGGLHGFALFSSRLAP